MQPSADRKQGGLYRTASQKALQEPPAMPLYKISCFCSSQNPLASSTFPFFFIFWSLYAKPRRMSSMGLRSAGVLLGYSRSLTDRPLFHLFTIMACHQMARLHFHQLRPLLPAAFTGTPAGPPGWGALPPDGSSASFPPPPDPGWGSRKAAPGYMGAWDWRIRPTPG